MNTLTHSDLQLCLRRCPVYLLEALQNNPGKVYVAGGFIRSVIADEEINDIDLFVPDEITAKRLAYDLLEGPNGRVPGARVVQTGNAYTVKGRPGPVVQIIYRWTFENPVEAIESFDFTIACAAFWWTLPPQADPKAVRKGQWVSVCDERFYSDLAAKRLTYRSPERNEDAGGSMLRVLKFYKRGYRIPVDSLGAVIARLNTGVSADGVEGLLRQNPDWTYERAESRVLTALLREVDPAVDPKHIAHLPAEGIPE